MSLLKATFLGLMSALPAGLALGGPAIPNWPAPATWSAPRTRGLTTLSETNPLPFQAVTPCRVADTRGNGFGGQYGPPSLVANATRSFAITGVCGIPASAAAVSFNFGALNVSGTGDLRVFPSGGSVPLVSTLNYNANTPNIANAAVVELGGGAITVQADTVSIDLIIDVNGYYYDGNSTLPLAPGEHFRIITDSGGDSAGIFQNKGTSFATSGVLGFTSGTTGTTYGVLGLGVSATAVSVGVRGLQEGTGSATFGVQGVTFSTSPGAAGVYGVDGSGDPGLGGFAIPMGVRGSSANGCGVFGVSKFTGVRGRHLDSTGTLDSEGVLGYSSSVGIFFFNGLVGSGTKSFVEPHPSDASKVIEYVSLEGPEAGTYFRGRARFERGMATIELPEDFRFVTDPESLSIQVTPIGEMATVAVTRIGIDGIVVRGSRDVEFFYLVNGVRRAYSHWNPVQENEKFFVPESPDAKMPAHLSDEERARLVANGTYNSDGTVNMNTAQRLGWARMWADREKAVAANAAVQRATVGERE